MTLRRNIAALSAAALATVLASRVNAVTTIWDGGAPVGNTNWNTAANWLGDVVPPTANDVQFATGFGSGTTIETNGNRTANSLLINTTTDFIISGDPFGFDFLTLNSGNITRTTTGNTIVDVNLAMGGNGTWNVASSGNVHLTKTLAETFPGRSFTKTGAGSVRLSGSTTYTGSTFINQGVLELEGAGTRSGTIVVSPGGTLALRNTNITGPVLLSGIGALPSRTLSGSSSSGSSLSGPITLLSDIHIDHFGPLTISGTISDGAGSFGIFAVFTHLRLLSANAYDGLTTIIGGSVTIAHPEALNSTTTIADGAQIILTDNITINRPLHFAAGMPSMGFAGGSGATWSGPITYQGTSSSPLPFAVQQSLNIAGSIGPAPWLAKHGPGTLNLSGSNDFDRLDIGEGTVAFQTSASVSPNSVTTLTSGAVVDLSASLTPQSAALELTGSGIGGQGALRVTAGNASWNGRIYLAGEVPIFVGQGATLTVGELTGPNNSALRKIGLGTLVLPAPSTHQAGTFIDLGTLSIGSDSSLGSGPVSITGGTLLFNATTLTSRNLTMIGGGLQAGAGATVTLNGSSISGGFLMGPGTFTPTNSASLNGVTALAGSNVAPIGPTYLNGFINRGNFSSNLTLTWNGGINSAGGNITLNSNTLSTTAFSNDGVITINNNATLLNTTNPLTSGGGSRITINPGGALNVTSNSLDLNGALLVNNGTITGPTNVNFGSLAKGSGTFGAVNVTDGGRFSPGNSPGSVTTGSTTWNSGGSYVVELADVVGNPNHDFWQVEGELLLSASPDKPFAISLASLDGLIFDPTRDYSWPILHADGGITGFDPSELILDTSSFKNPIGSGRFSIQSSPTDIVITFSAVPEPPALSLIVITAIAAAHRRRFRINSGGRES
jgi:autotransporter-associated beta strand protein